jgi:hypothetical protein
MIVLNHDCAFERLQTEERGGFREEPVSHSFRVRRAREQVLCRHDLTRWEEARQ